MSADGSIVRFFGDGEYRFRLPIKRIQELQDLCNAGVMAIFRRIQNEQWYEADVRETIRLGLIGGGMSEHTAFMLVKRYIEDRLGLLKYAEDAIHILMAALVGDFNDPVGKAEAEKGSTERPTTATDAFSFPHSTAPGPSSDILPPKSVQ